MKSPIKKPGFIFITIIFWLMLFYMVAALTWWYIELRNQNTEMYGYKLAQIDPNSVAYPQIKIQADKAFKIKNTQYLGEGLTFLFVILLGAVFVYRAVRQQFRLSELQNNFMMAVTHELKTPIAILQLNLETLQKYQLDNARKNNILAMSLLENQRLNELTDNILAAARLESGSFNKTREEIDLHEIVRDTLQEYMSRFNVHQDHERKFIEHLEKDIFVFAEPVLLKLVINNLLSNAIKYSPKSSFIEISLLKQEKFALLEIKDEGGGVPDIEKKRIFEKFYRIGNEATRNAKGTGLGLYLCKKIISGFGGKIFVQDHSAKGSVFKILLPILT
ncbi:MAG: ATP-binding protein [Chitinophagaceae bacterium]